MRHIVGRCAAHQLCSVMCLNGWLTCIRGEKRCRRRVASWVGAVPSLCSMCSHPSTCCDAQSDPHSQRLCRHYEEWCRRLAIPNHCPYTAQSLLTHLCTMYDFLSHHNFHFYTSLCCFVVAQKVVHYSAVVFLKWWDRMIGMVANIFWNGEIEWLEWLQVFSEIVR